MLHQRLHLKQNNKNKKLQAQKLPAIYVWRNYVDDFRLVDWICSARAPFEAPKERKK